MFSNIHPLLVHFPISFLGLYAILELARFNFLIRQSYWFYVKAVLVIVGTLSVWPTVLAGIIMAQKFKDTDLNRVIHVHAPFAIFTALLFTVIAIAYALEWRRMATANGKAPVELSSTGRLAKNLVEGKFIIVLALIGLVTISITGALGASMVYGPDSDPFVKVVYHLFFTN